MVRFESCEDPHQMASVVELSFRDVRCLQTKEHFHSIS